jgi:hypothetical protein
MIKMHLDEQVVIDGICVFMADGWNGVPEDVEVKELGYQKGGQFYTVAKIFDEKRTYDTEQIKEGIAMFLEQYHNFNQDEMAIDLIFIEGQGITAQVVVGFE